MGRPVKWQRPKRWGKGEIIPDHQSPTRWIRGILPCFGDLITMSLQPDDIRRIASLARLSLTSEQSERMLGQINGFFDLVEQMRAVDTSGIEPLAHPVAAMQDIALRLRDDVASEPNQREANQRSAPSVERGLFLVPRVIE
jgi:aspartyl-tRNA(Asn)/glutamyl-tRNA(Gln) amidotransferase subunit C